MEALLNITSLFAKNCKQGLFGFEPWTKYLELDPTTCSIKNGFEAGQVWLIAAAVLEMMLRAAGLASAVFVMWGGFKYLTSQGNSENTRAARRTIIYSLVGVAVTIIASTVVSFVLNELIGSVYEDTGLPATEATSNQIEKIFSIAYAIAGGIAALMVVIGSFNYVVSAGDPQKTSTALNTIIYALVGLVIIVFANVITGFVIGSV